MTISLLRCSRQLGVIFLCRMASFSAAKTVLITGCSRGIGAGLVRASLAEPSARVIATCRSPESAEELKELAKSHAPDRLVILPLDTTSLDSYKGIVSSLNDLGIDSIDILIANAGISSPDHPSDPILTCTEKTMMDVFQTNCVGTLLTLQTFTPFLLRGDTKLVVLLSSRLASITQCAGVGGYTSYRASKAAMNMLAMTYSEDFTVKGANIRTLCMHPGWVQTDMGERGGRKASVSVPDCVAGISNMMNRAVAVQSELKGNKEYPTYELFEKQLLEHRVVFTAYDGEMLPW